MCMHWINFLTIYSLSPITNVVLALSIGIKEEWQKVWCTGNKDRDRDRAILEKEKCILRSENDK
jgi:hypothetical protein